MLSVLPKFSFLYIQIYLMIVHTLKICTFHFSTYFMNIFSFLRSVELRHFFISNAKGVSGLESVTPTAFSLLY